MNHVRIAFLSVLGAVPALAGSYTFAKVYSSAIQVPDPGVAINNSGAVAYKIYTGPTALDVAIYLATGPGNSVKLVDNSGPYRSLEITGLTDNGTVLFKAQLRSGGTGVYAATTSGVTPIGTGNDIEILDADPTMNAAGDVSFLRANKIQIVTGGSVKTIADLGSDICHIGNINSQRAVPYGCNQKIVAQKEGSAVTISNSATLFGLGKPSINDSGTVAFTGATPEYRLGVYTGSGGSLRTVADRADFSYSIHPWINNQGTVLINGLQTASPYFFGIMTGPDPVADRVIGIGDALFGSTAAAVDASSQSGGRPINDKGQIAFTYAINGTPGVPSEAGVAIATPSGGGSGDNAATPVLTSGSVAQGATYQPGIIAGSWAQVKGSNLSPVERIWQSSDFNNGSALPIALDGVQVKVNGIPAAVYYISGQQVSFQVPSVGLGLANVQVIRDGIASNTVTADVVGSAPGLFTYTAGGKTYPAAVFNSSGIVVGDPSVVTGVRLAQPGDRIQLYATGLTSSPAGTTISAQPGINGVGVTIGSSVASVEYAGLVGVGLWQINVVVPSIRTGDNSVRLSYNGKESQADVFIPVQSPIPPGKKSASWKRPATSVETSRQ